MKAFKDEHLKIAESFDNIADALGYLEKADDAMGYYSKALVMRQKILGEEHLLVAESHLKMGKLCVQFGVTQGFQSLKESQRIYEKLFGQENLMTQEVSQLIERRAPGRGSSSLGLLNVQNKKVTPIVGSMEIDATS